MKKYKLNAEERQLNSGKMKFMILLKNGREEKQSRWTAYQTELFLNNSYWIQ